MESGSKARLILLVGDDDSLMTAESAILQDEGFAAPTAATVEEALTYIAAHQPDLVLMDVDLGEGDVAIDAAREIIAQHDVPIVFLTCGEDEATIARIRTVSRYGFILKSSGFIAQREVIRLALELFAEHQELRMSRDLYRSVTDLTGDIVVRHDREGRWMFVNEQARRVGGLPAGDVSDLNYLDYVHPKDQDATKRAAETMRREQVPVYGLINQVDTPEGMRTYQWNSIPVFDEHGEYAGFQSTGRDITAEEQRKQEIRALLEQREILLRELQHRVKNDLGLVQSLLSLQAHQITEKQAKDALSEAGARVSVIARIYETLAHAGNGGAVQLNPLLEQVVADTTSTVFGGTAVLTTDIQERSVSARTAVTVGIIVNEILTNTTKYASGATDVSVSLTGSGPDYPLQLTITDDGPGFPAQVLQGTSYGLGLSIITSLVDQHGGTFHLSQAATGPGARTEITLPVE